MSTTTEAAPTSRWEQISTLLVILLGMGSVGLATGAIGPLLVQISATTGEHIAQIAVVTPFLGLAVAGLVTGWIAARLGVRGMLCAGAVVFGLSGLVGFFFGASGWALLSASFLVGATATVVRVGAALLLGQAYTGEARSRVIGYSLSVGGLVSVLTVWLGGTIADWVGWRFAFLLITGGAALILVFVLAASRTEAPIAAEAQTTRPRLSELAPATPYLVAVFLVMMVGGMTPTHMPLLLRAEGVQSAKAMALVMSLQALLTMLSSLCYARLQARIGRLAVAAIAVALMVVYGVIAAAAPVWWLFGLGTSAMGAASGLILPYLLDGVYARASLSVRGYALGAYTTLSSLGVFAPSFVLRPLREVTGLQGLYGVIAAATAAIGAIFLLQAFSQGRRAAAG